MEPRRSHIFGNQAVQYLSRHEGKGNSYRWRSGYWQAIAASLELDQDSNAFAGNRGRRQKHATSPNSMPLLYAHTTEHDPQPTTACGTTTRGANNIPCPIEASLVACRSPTAHSQHLRATLAAKSKKQHVKGHHISSDTRLVSAVYYFC